MLEAKPSTLNWQSEGPSPYISVNGDFNKPNIEVWSKNLRKVTFCPRKFPSPQHYNVLTMRKLELINKSNKNDKY